MEISYSRSKRHILLPSFQREPAQRSPRYRSAHVCVFLKFSRAALRQASARDQYLKTTPDVTSYFHIPRAFVFLKEYCPAACTIILSAIFLLKFSFAPRFNELLATVEWILNRFFNYIKLFIVLQNYFSETLNSFLLKTIIYEVLTPVVLKGCYLHSKC